MKRQLIWILILIAAVSLLIMYSPINKVSAEVSVTLEVLNPRGEIEPPPTLAPTPRVMDLAGKKIGLYWNGKEDGDLFWDVVEGLLKKKFPTATILRYRGPFDLGDKIAATMAKECDTFLYGVGD